MPEEMASKFWGVREDGSSSEDDDAENSDAEQSDAESEDAKAPKKSAGVPASGARWAAMEDSSDDEDERRVVRSAKDKQWSNLQQIIKTMANHRKIEDFAQVQAGFDSLLKAVQKARAVIEKEGLPPFFIRVISELETYTNDRFADKDWLKKLTKAKTTAFNTLRAKVRKGLEEYREKVDAFREDPSQFAEDDDADSVFGSDDSSDMSADSSDSESDSGSDSESDEKESAKKRSATDDSGEENEWSSSSDEDEEPSGEVDLHQLAFERWGKKTDDTGKKSKLKKISEKAPKLRVPKQQVEQIIPHVGRSKEASIFYPGEKIDAETISKKLLDVTALRGRKGFDRLEQIRHLRELADKAAIVGSKTVLEILGHLISAYFDANLGAFACMPSTQWLLCYQQIDAALSILRKEKDCYFPFVVTEEDEEDSILEAENEVSSTTALLKAQQTEGAEGTSKDDCEGMSKEAKARMSTALICTSFLERLDDELTKALQLTDVHAEEYKVRLGQTVDLLALLWKAYIFFSSSEQSECARNISLRILEHIYYKNDAIATRMWELVKKRLDADEAATLCGDFAANRIVPKLVRKNLESSADAKTKTRVVLYAAYYESLHGRFYEARDLLQTANIHELASQCNISTQILFNRNLVQLGLAAFRLGLISEAHHYLTEVCAMGRYKELLAQGLSNTRGVEKTPEQERLEKRRLLPYHMHIAADLVEAIHYICAMLLEVPSMAANPFDYSKKPIARNFRRLLEAYDRQIFTGPPENLRETVMAATKALQKGNWKTCSDHIMSLKFWGSLPESEKVKEILTNRVKQEALRTYLFSYSSLYDSFNIKQLSEMFSLPVSMTHSIVSKMMIQGSLSGSWDDTSECVLINRIERTPLQVLALQLTEKIAQAVDQNEVVLNYRNPKYVMAQANQREDRGGRRYDDRWTGPERRFYGRDDQADRNFSNQYRSGVQSFGGPRFGANRQQAAAVSGQRRRW